MYFSDILVDWVTYFQRSVELLISIRIAMIPWIIIEEKSILRYDMKSIVW